MSIEQKRKRQKDSGSTQFTTVGSATAQTIADVKYSDPYFLKFVQVSSNRLQNIRLQRYYAPNKVLTMDIQPTRANYYAVSTGYFGCYWYFSTGLYCYGFKVSACNTIAADVLTVAWEAVEA